jgi:hypothetical protein
MASESMFIGVVKTEKAGFADPPRLKSPDGGAAALARR